MDIQNSFTSRPDEFGIVDSCSPNLLRHGIADEMACSKPCLSLLLLGPVRTVKSYLINSIKSIIGQSVKPMSKRQTVEDTMFTSEGFSTGIEGEIENAFLQESQIRYVEPIRCDRSSFIDTLRSFERQTVEDTMFTSEGFSTGIEGEQVLKKNPTNFDGNGKSSMIDYREKTSFFSQRKWGHSESFNFRDIPGVGIAGWTYLYRHNKSDVVCISENAQIQNLVEGHETFGALEPDWRPKQSREKELRKVSSKWTKPKEFKFRIDTRELEQLRKCKVCLDKDSCIIFFPCRHMATCEICEGFLQRCPICRSPINKAVKINEG